MSQYFIMDTEAPHGMLLYSIPNPNHNDRWLKGRPFENPPQSVIRVQIQEGHEHSPPPDFFAEASIMSSSLYHALIEAGVDNIKGYDAILENHDKRVSLSGYKAVNIIGVAAVADTAKTKFSSENPSRLIDASIEVLNISQVPSGRFLIFRIAESIAAIFIHESVKKKIEARSFSGAVFREPSKVYII